MTKSRNEHIDECFTSELYSYNKEIYRKLAELVKEIDDFGDNYSKIDQEAFSLVEKYFKDVRALSNANIIAPQFYLDMAQKHYPEPPISYQIMLIAVTTLSSNVLNKSIKLKGRHRPPKWLGDRDISKIFKRLTQDIGLEPIEAYNIIGERLKAQGKETRHELSKLTGQGDTVKSYLSKNQT